MKSEYSEPRGEPIGYDFGSCVAGFCALARPDVFGSVVLMIAPFAGAPALACQADSLRLPAQDPIHAGLSGIPCGGGGLNIRPPWPL